jgi:hypothetical protein
MGVVGGFVVTATTAQAGLIPNKVTITPEGGYFRWTYNVVVTSDVYVRPGDYFTIYDFAGALPGQFMSPSAQWALSEQNIGITPSQTNPNDNPNIPNYTWTYTGTETIIGSAGLGNFSLLSPYSFSAMSDFTSATHRQDNDLSEHTVTTTVVPVAAASEESPEPATLALVGMALPVVGWKLRRRK